MWHLGALNATLLFKELKKSECPIRMISNIEGEETKITENMLKVYSNMYKQENKKEQDTYGQYIWKIHMHM